MKIATVMSVCGHQKYFDCASISIPSFIHNNPNHHLFVFTSDVGKLMDLLPSF